MRWNSKHEPTRPYVEASSKHLKNLETTAVTYLTSGQMRQQRAETGDQKQAARNLLTDKPKERVPKVRAVTLA